MEVRSCNKYRILIPLSKKKIQPFLKDRKLIKKVVSGLLNDIPVKEWPEADRRFFYDNENKYPVIQYATYPSHLEVVGFHIGGSLVKSLFPYLKRLRSHGDILSLKEVWLGREEVELGFVTTNRMYRITNYLALNSSNYKEVKTYTREQEAHQIEKALRGHIRGMAKRLLETQVQYSKLTIIQIDSRSRTLYKDQHMLIYSLVFQCNMSLPEGLHIGKGAALGYGHIESLEE